MQRDVEKVAEIYDALRRKRINTVVAFAAPEVEVIQSVELPWGGIYAGRTGLQQFFANVQVHLDARSENERVLDAGSQVIVIGRFRGKARVTGLEFDVPSVDVWTLREGLIVRLESYTDNATVLAALGA